MPEGHSIRRLALAFSEWFVGHACDTSSPQGRFARGAARLNGMTMVDAQSVGKHLFLEFGSADGAGAETTRAPLWLHVHLGLYGSWRFYGSPGTSVTPSIGAPRLPDVLASENDMHEDAGGDAFEMVRLASEVGPRSNEGIRLSEDFGIDNGHWSPPPPRGAVRLRIVTETVAADLTGPTQCEVLDAAGVEVVLGRLGPDPLDDESPAERLRSEFVGRVRGSRRPVGELVMDQSVVAGVGNIYRAEGLFRGGISPFRRGNNVSEKRLRNLWDDFVVLLDDGVRRGNIYTVIPDWHSAEIVVEDDEAEKWFVYKRDGKPCLVCGTPVRTRVMQGRNLFWCPSCQR